MHPYLRGITSPTADQIHLSTDAIRRISAVQNEPPFGSEHGVDEVKVRFELGGRFDTLVFDGEVLRREPLACRVCQRTFTPEQWMGVMDQVFPSHTGCWELRSRGTPRPDGPVRPSSASATT